jgi:hypothetical protein
VIGILFAFPPTVMAPLLLIVVLAAAGCGLRGSSVAEPEPSSPGLAVPASERQGAAGRLAASDPPTILPGFSAEGPNAPDTIHANVLRRLYDGSMSHNKNILDDTRGLVVEHADGTVTALIAHTSQNSTMRQRFVGIDQYGRLVYVRADGTVAPMPAQPDANAFPALDDPLALPSEGVFLAGPHEHRGMFWQNDPLGGAGNRVWRWVRGEPVDAAANRFTTPYADHTDHAVVVDGHFYASIRGGAAGVQQYPNYVAKSVLGADPLVHPDADPAYASRTRYVSANYRWFSWRGRAFNITGINHLGGGRFSDTPACVAIGPDPQAPFGYALEVVYDDHMDLWDRTDQWGRLWRGVPGEWHLIPSILFAVERPWGVFFHTPSDGGFIWENPGPTTLPVRIYGPGYDPGNPAEPVFHPFSSNPNEQQMVEWQGRIFGITPATRPDGPPHPEGSHLWYLDEDTWTWIKAAPLADYASSQRHNLMALPDGTLVLATNPSSQVVDVRVWKAR